MKIFIYKTLIVSFVFLMIFEVLVGSRINKLESQISNLKSPKNLELIKNKIFKEIKNGTKKKIILPMKNVKFYLSLFIK